MIPSLCRFSIKDFSSDWLSELGDQYDRTNMEAIATWVGNQYDILFAKDKRQRLQRLRLRFKTIMENWIKSYLKKQI